MYVKILCKIDLFIKYLFFKFTEIFKYLYICLDTTPQLLPRIRLITVGAVVAGCVCASKARTKTVQLRLGSRHSFHRKTKKLKVGASLASSAKASINLDRSCAYR